MPPNDSQVPSRVCQLLEKKIEKLGAMLALAEKQKEAMAQKNWQRLGQVVEQRMQYTTEVDALDKRLADVLGGQQGNQGTHLNLFRSKPIRSLLAQLRDILRQLSDLEAKSMSGLEEQLESVQAQLKQIRKTRVGVLSYAPKKSPAARFVDLQG
ncbi:MAG: flagellar export chaperone FlgN [Candidatus Tectomicrobia bacterium]|uniref:Flagellar export chaperone FlgN n=1 Tax=Tectimicrobiota bacterium TaxID=2528274 RepID=A0A932GNW1_UNCTE|nr:flagellar export chaperone FlgN [Candidatus Tectomicrobia bacterium]